jgi:shikimate dehydrogenase/3-dehydroquinate dehydratase type I
MTELVASVLASTHEDMVRALSGATAGADLVELRVDGLAEPNLDRLRAARTRPLVLTCRPKNEGGLYQGPEAERRELLGRALELGFDYVDVEIDSANEALLSRRKGAKVVLSHHDLIGMPSRIPALIERAADLGAEVIKIAARVASLAEALALADWGRAARQRGLRFVPVALGPAGRPARVLGARLGADWVYAAARGLPPTGEGQIGLEELLEVYRFRSIGPATRLYGILGSPVGASLSPVMHNAVFAEEGRDAVYLPFEEDDLPAFVGAARRLGVAGLSVTRPHKEALLALLDGASERARRIGAVNTVTVKDGKWWGDNTDYLGLLRPLERRTSLSGKRAWILGAGGAARAAAFALSDRGAQVEIVARRAEAARALATVVGGRGRSDSEAPIGSCDVLINATPVGGRPNTGESPLPLPGSIPREAVVLDMVVDPEETALLASAKRAGAAVIPGLEMLIEQALLQLDLWWGGAEETEEGRRKVMERAARGQLRRAAGAAVDKTRYSRQVLFSGIGREGQARIGKARVLQVGAGALGSVASEMLVRAGVGYLRLLDRDYLEESNLQRQTLYDEEDVRRALPKAIAGAERLARVNSEVTVEPVIADLGPENVETYLSDVDLAIDGTDNFETRFLLNDACVKERKDWIYGACVGSYGLGLVIRPGKTACLRCLLEEEPPPGSSPTCDTAGVIAPIVHAIAAFQVSEALKLLAGRESDLTGKMFSLDVWSGRVDAFQPKGPRPDCPACGLRDFEYLEGRGRSRATVLCGREAVQVLPATRGGIELEEVAARLKSLGEVSVNPYLLRFQAGEKTVVLFADGRAIVHGTNDPGEARSLYARYVGL